MSKNNFSRVPELDGVRGLAILLVMMVHIIPFNPVQINLPFMKYIKTFASMGWVGVDIFFVLSGFLITSILLRTKKKENYFKNFYARRILRIFPLYYITISAVFIIVAIFNPSQRGEITASLPWYYLYISNWGFAIERLADPFAIGLTWSLAIEEQFYLVWPLVIYHLNSKKLAILSSILVILSPIIRIAFSMHKSSLDYGEFFYHATFTRLDSLILGALIAIAFESDSWKRRLKPVAAPILLVMAGMIIYLISLQPTSPLWDNPPMYIYGFTFLALGAGSLIIMLSTYAQNNPIRWAFRNPVLSFFGKYSYAIYIFHRIPIPFLQDFFKKNFGNGITAWLLFGVLAMSIPIIMALISWNLFENPILNLKKHFEYNLNDNKESTASITAIADPEQG